MSAIFAHKLTHTPRALESYIILFVPKEISISYHDMRIGNDQLFGALAIKLIKEYN
jgi:hypothetical protein